MNDGLEKEYGFKLPTFENWLSPDDVWKNFVIYLPEQSVYMPQTAENWLAEIREPSLLPPVPREIRRLFEVARSAIIYGFLCYPLLTLGIEQLRRVLEAATRIRADVSGCPRKKRTGEPDELASFNDAINWLNKVGAIADSDLGYWRNMQWLRNHASHPKMQSIQLPGQAIEELQATAHLINDLFEGL